MNITVYLTGILCAVISASCQLRSFPDDFKFGTATASYQVEGGWNSGGKGENIWDYLTHNNPTYIKDLSNGDEACDSYNNYKRDVEMLVDLGVDYYRFSLSWSRILPTGFANEINEDGVAFYDNLINELLANGIQPYVTIYHWDLPQPLQVLGGWANPLVADYYVEYAAVVFEKFGDRVKNWVTFNEPNSFCISGYGDMRHAPAVNMGGYADYLCSKTILIAHAKAYRMYHSVYDPSYEGKVSLTDHLIWAEAASNSAEDIEAQDRFRGARNALYYDPIFKGDFPEKMKEIVEEYSLQQGYPRSKLPEFTEEEKTLIKGTADFFAMNHYTTYMLQAGNTNEKGSILKDLDISTYNNPNWKLSDSSSWLSVNPDGFRASLNWIKDRYDNPEIMVFENGYSIPTGSSRFDDDRVEYYRLYLDALLGAIYEDGCNVTAYTAWSIMDNFEWADGYSSTFGLYEVDFSSPTKERREKKSALVYKEIIRSRVVDYSYEPTVLDIKNV